MSKGKLKVALKNQKTAEDFGKKAGKKQQKPVKPVLEDPEESSLLESEEVPSLIDTSAPLSKKEKRKLKKMIAKAKEAQPAEESEESDAEEELDLEKLAASESESDINDDDDDDDDDESEEDDESNEGSEEEKDDDEEEAEEEDIPLSDAELDSDADVVPHSKLTVNNIAALKDSLARIALPWENHSFVEHQAVLAAEKAEAGIKDLYDDTERELAFYRQGLDAVKQGRSTLLKLNVPFSRPLDYFAEMVKSDEHMDKLKGKLLKEAADKKASEDAKKQRQLKKFGKKVQHETLQERAKQKRDTLDRIKSLKKKRGANELSNDSEFQIALEEATAEDRPQKRAKPNGKRLAKDAKYGLGGQKRGMRRNDAESSADIFNQRGKKGKPARPGKSKRSRN
ncbi:rRNA-processing protein EBP2 [Metschnikowia aff. pulcherrima]|uniref:rRNA-processing protein EBP2 n=1 Tax=Metschnikowia aff. pulcherrima TaxID=2163413 RepID=A0A4P6XTP3_9ASCO|nr:rRNA-processing protein EBP2 [Metschnikowia aff. pulcherrima]